jgi:Flp pilus assembly secretin CpaC
MDGRTICLGGIIQNQINSTVNKVPLLGDIPLLGSLFKNTTKTDNKDELLVFLTPHVIKNTADAQLIKDENEDELHGEARNMLPTAPPAPTGTSGPSIPQPTTTVSVSPNIQTTPAVPVGPTGATVVPITPAAPAAPAVTPDVNGGQDPAASPATS